MKKPSPFLHELKKIFTVLKNGREADLLLYLRQESFANSAIFTATIICLVTVALSSRSMEMLLFAASLFIFFAGKFFYLKKSTVKFHIKRIFPKSAREMAEVEIKYKITSPHDGHGTKVLVTDNFEGQERQGVFFSAQVKPGAQFKSILSTLNNGMGMKPFGPIKLEFTDSNHLFSLYKEFERMDAEKDKILVYPRLEKSRRVNVAPDSYSFLSGDMDVQKRGDSQVFRAVREYRFGDSSKTINWKKSAKLGKLYSNEHEKCVNSNIKIILELSQDLHYGHGHQSTWEIAKDLALTISSQQIHTTNSLTTITNSGIIGPGRGQSFINEMEIILPKLPLAKAAPIGLMAKSKPFISPSDSVFYITPFLHSKVFYNNLKHLNLYSLDFETPISLFLIDALELLWDEANETQDQALKAMAQISTEGLENLFKQRSQYKFSLSILKITADSLRSSQGKLKKIENLPDHNPFQRGAK